MRDRHWKFPISMKQYMQDIAEVALKVYKEWPLKYQKIEGEKKMKQKIAAIEIETDASFSIEELNTGARVYISESEIFGVTAQVLTIWQDMPSEKDAVPRERVGLPEGAVEVPRGASKAGPAKAGLVVTIESGDVYVSLPGGVPVETGINPVDILGFLKVHNKGELAGRIIEEAGP